MIGRPTLPSMARDLMTTVMIAAALVAVPTIATSSATGAPPPTREYKFLDMAPDGARIAAVEPVAGEASDAEPRGPIVVRRVDDGLVVERLDPCGQCRYSGLSWSRDSTQLAFLAAGDEPDGVRVELATVAGGRTRPGAATVATLAIIKGVASTPRWSPDGSELALLVTIAARKKPGALEAGAPRVGEIGSTADEQRIAIVPRAGGALRLVSPADTYIYEYDWTPDGKGFVATGAKGNGDNNWWVAEIAAIDIATGASRTIARPGFQVAMPRATPDGKGVVFIGGLMSDFGTVGGEVYEVPIDGGAPTSRTPGFRGSFLSLAWRQGRLYATALIVDHSALVQIGEPGTAPRVLWSAPVAASTGDDAAGMSTRSSPSARTASAPRRSPRISLTGRPSPRGRSARCGRSRTTTTRSRSDSRCAA